MTSDQCVLLMLLDIDLNKDMIKNIEEFRGWEVCFRQDDLEILKFPYYDKLFYRVKGSNYDYRNSN